MQLDKKQQEFVDEVLNGARHVILTGKAGTGKSVALASAVGAAIATGKDVRVMAPTAMAASIHRDAGLESGTIHHALRWNPARTPMPYKMLEVCGLQMCLQSPPDQDRLLVIDEASMVGLWLFEILARDLGDGKDTRPFDGRRVVLVGDWAQLPPVVGSDEMKLARKLKELRQYGPPDGCALYHAIFCKQPPKAVILEESHRANSAWFDSLNALRECWSAMSLDKCGIIPPINETGSAGAQGVHMCFRRVTAHTRNAECIARLHGREHTIQLRDGEMVLKEGCEVIVTSNRAGGDYFNGSRAVFSGVLPSGEILLDGETPVAMLADGNWTRSNKRATEDVNEGKAAEGVRKAKTLLGRFGEILEAPAKEWLQMLLLSENAQLAAQYAEGALTFQPFFPILPGYALTVHKAQGMTLDRVIIEEDVFWSIAPARLPYVALSRVRDAENVALNGFASHQVKVKPDAAFPVLMARLKGWAK